MSRHVLIFTAAVSLLAGLVQVSQAQDTFTLRIDSTTYFYGELCYAMSMWENGTLNEIHFMVVENDTVYDRGNQEPGYPPEYKNYVATPLYPTIGTSWYSNFGNVSQFTVSDTLLIAVPADTFFVYSYDINDSATGEYVGYWENSLFAGNVSWKQIWPGDTVTYVLEDTNLVGGSGLFPLAVGNEWNFVFGIHDTIAWSGVGQSIEIIPNSFALQNHPNPFNPSTVLSFELRAASFVRLEVFNPAGSWITTLAEGWKTAGVHEVIFDGSGLPSGMYLARLTARNYTAVQKLVLLK